MKEFQTQGMTCKSCVFHITRSIQDADPSARVDVDLKAQRIAVESGLAASEIAERIKEAGYAVLAAGARP